MEERLFDVFVRLPDGKPLLVASVEDLKLAEQHAKRWMEKFKGECIVYSEQHGRVFRALYDAGKIAWAG